MLIAIEGVDGAGKRTLSEGLRKEFEAAGRSVATLAFPRYGNSVTADIAAEALHGEHGDLASSVFAMATLFALDRAAAVDEIHGLCLAYEVVILDRYVASNAAYSAARLHQDSAGEAVAWVGRMEYERFGLPNRTGRYCSRCPSSWPARGRVGGPAATRAGPATATNATMGCSSAPARCTPSWPPRAGVVGGWLSTRTSIRGLWRRH